VIARRLVLRLLNALADQKEHRASRRFFWQCDPVALGAIGAILIYQRVAPGDIRSRCRFVPTCSEYGLLALKKFYVREAFRLSASRVRRCVGFGGSGIDWP